LLSQGHQRLACPRQAQALRCSFKQARTNSLFHLPKATRQLWLADFQTPCGSIHGTCGRRCVEKLKIIPFQNYITFTT
jgi:hypothetical protein